MQFILPILYTLVFMALIQRMNYFEISNLSRIKLIFLFCLKLIAGAIACILYTKYYSSADFYSYFSDSQLWIQHVFGKNTNVALQTWNSNFDPIIFNSSRILIVLNGILHVFSFGNFYVHVVFFCFFSFVGLVALFKAFNKHFEEKTTLLVVGIFLVPTIVFWTSTTLKETVAIGILGQLIYYSDFGLKKDLKWSTKISIIVLFVLLFFIKPYVAFALVPVWIVNIVVTRTSNQMLLLKYASVFAILTGFGFLLSYINPDYSLLKLLSHKQLNAISEARGGVFLENETNFICMDYYSSKDHLSKQSDSSYKIIPGSKFILWKQNNMADTTFVENSTDTASYKLAYKQIPANSVITIKKLRPDMGSFILYAPIAMINVIIRPSVFEITSWLHFVVAIENLWIILLIILVLFFFDKKNQQKNEVLVFCFVFALILFVLIGITTPVIGAMIRYRTIGMVVFIPLCLLLIDWEKLNKVLPNSFIKR